MNETTPVAPTEAPLTSEADVRTSMIESLRATAMLADVTIGTWSGERSDQAAMDQLKKDNGATGKVGRVVKYLMSGADARLKDARSAFHAVRLAHVSLTQPWISDVNADRLRGPRLLPNTLFETYLQTITARKRAATDALQQLLDNYDADVAAAKANLGGLADADYPTPDQIKAMFYIKVDFEPLPASADFRNLPPAFAGKLAESLAKKQERMLTNAQAHIWSTLRERITHARDRFADVEKTFKVTTVEHLRDVASLARAWNVAGDERIGITCAKITAAMDGVTAKDLREDPALRAATTVRLGEIVTELDEWGV